VATDGFLAGAQNREAFVQTKFKMRRRVPDFTAETPRTQRKQSRSIAAIRVLAGSATFSYNEKNENAPG